MGKFIGELDTRQTIEKHKVYWQLLTELSYVTDKGETYTVPAGFKSDLASIPRLFWAILPPFGRYSKAAVIHDYLLANNKVIPDNEKLTIDRINYIFKESMRELNVNKVQIAVIHFAVQLWLKSKTRILKAWKAISLLRTIIGSTAFSWWTAAVTAWKAYDLFKLFRKK
jgi:hypothetical protein